MCLDVIDFTDLQKRGLLKEEKNEQVSDTIDFTSNTISTPVTVEQSNQFDMLSSLAQVGESKNNAVQDNSNEISLKLDTIVNKIEDTMYKIENISSKIAAIEARLNPFIGL